jgi:very-short-patch-repair endonuclease
VETPEQTIKEVKTMKGKRHTTESFRKEIMLRHGSKYTIKGEYRGAGYKEKILTLFNECGHENMVSPNSLLQGFNCRVCDLNKKSENCAGHNESLRKKSESKFRKEISGKFDLLSEYSNNKKIVLLRHLDCGETFSVTPLGFGGNCPICNKNKDGRFPTYNSEEYSEYIKTKFEGRFELIGPYKNQMSPIEVKTSSCGHRYHVIPKYFNRNGSVCPICNEWANEKKIESVLKSLGLKFERKFRTEECKNIKTLEFDFLVDLGKGKIAMIEYDGEFHYQEIYGQEKLDAQKKRDRKKDEFCAEKGYKLIRVPFWEKDNIEKILSRELNPRKGEI